MKEAVEVLGAVMFALLDGSVVGAGREEEVEEEVRVAEEVFVAVALVVGSSLFAVERKRRARINV